ncbi:hypothetical protein [Gellertiella hungarica]|uniref:Uncharacterized protein n=1 Tax=Gellertiella hungarica TaxID=1572859 RepID=A0A7W6J3G8_9HYPH|nr:hypothetical protein [Gellertiella hungarica]MBB4064048.1 hypothetical protein [Gellertiella hungarica]
MSDTHFLIDPDGVVENIIVGSVSIPGYACIPQTPELVRVGIGWVYDPAHDAFVDPRAPALTGHDPDVQQNEFVWSPEHGTYVNAALAAQESSNA